MSDHLNFIDYICQQPRLIVHIINWVLISLIRILSQHNQNYQNLYLYSKMTCQDIMAVRKLMNQRYDDHDSNMNPFCNILFSENWKWPSTSIPHNFNTKTKNCVAKTSLKREITQWLLSLDCESKCAYTVIKNHKFIKAFLQTYTHWNPNKLYHIYLNRKIPNFESANQSNQIFQQLIRSLRIAWLDDPVLYLQLDPQEAEVFFLRFVNLADKVSNFKIFEYAHKIKNKQQPEQNLLWFTEQSFQELSAWLFNEFEKVITKNYFDHNNFDIDIYQKLKSLKEGLSHRKYHANHEKVKKLLNMKISDAISHSPNDYIQFQNRVKSYQDEYYEEVALLVDYEKSNQEGEKKKKKKNKKKKQKKSQVETVTQIPVQISQIEVERENKVNEKVQETSWPLIEKEKKGSLYEQTQNDKVSFFQELQSSQSISSGQWNNKKKSPNKSGKSHPQLDNTIDKSLLIEETRSLSQKAGSDPHRTGQKQQYDEFSQKTDQKPKKYKLKDAIESEYYQSKQQSLEIQNEYEDVKDQKQQQNGFKNQDEQLQEPKINSRNKKRKRKNMTIIKELSSRISQGLISRQINNFVDSLSTQTNNLYEYKRVAFERIQCFIQSIFPTSQAMLFGSNAVGLSLPTSDIDIMLFNLPCSTREEATEILGHLSVQINTMGWIVSCSAYLSAKVPVIKLQIDPCINYLATKRKCDYMMSPMIDPRILPHLQVKKTKKQFTKTHYHNEDTHTFDHEASRNNQIIKVDISVNLNGEGNLGAQSTELMRNWIEMYPQIHRVILAFKYILVKRGFSSNFKGGIGSYCLFIMVAAFITEYPELQQREDGQFLLSILKFYGEDFQNHTKSICLRNFNSEQSTNFISLEETYNRIASEPNLGVFHTYMHSPQIDSHSFLNTIKENPLRIFDPLNNRIMSGNCHFFPQIKAEFRRIHKELKQIQYNAQKEVQITINKTEATKMLENKKSIDKWLNKYEIRSGLSIKKIFDGDC